MKHINNTSSLKPPRRWLEIILPHGFSVISFNARVALQLWDLSRFGSLKASANRLRGKMLLVCTETSSFSKASASQIFSKAAFHVQFMYGLMFWRNFNFQFCILVSKEILNMYRKMSWGFGGVFFLVSLACFSNQPEALPTHYQSCQTVRAATVPKPGIAIVL